MMSAVLIVLSVVAAIALAALIAFFLAFYLRPIAVTRWMRRGKLLRGGFRETQIATSVGRQTVIHGGRGPVVVLLHGAGDEAGTWYHVAPALKDKFEFVIPDFAGHGKSEPRSGTLSLGTVLSGLEQVLDSGPWKDAPLVLVGNSMGAWQAMLYAHKHPERVRQVVLMGGGPLKTLNELGLTPKTREEAARTMDLVLDPSTSKRPGFVLDDLVRISKSGAIARLLAAGEEDIAKYLLEGKLSDFAMSVDLVWGTSDRLVPLEYAQRLQAQLPRTTLTVIERCGHAPQLERPEKFMHELLRVLQSHPEQRASARGDA